MLHQCTFSALLTRTYLCQGPGSEPIAMICKPFFFSPPWPTACYSKDACCLLSFLLAVLAKMQRPLLAHWSHELLSDPPTGGAEADALEDLV